jgi:hypothetical protein
MVAVRKHLPHDDFRRAHYDYRVAHHHCSMTAIVVFRVFVPSIFADETSGSREECDNTD